MVRLTGLEPALLSELEPKSNVYANFTTGAYLVLLLKFTCRELTGNKCTVVTQPKSRASASSATPAYSILLLKLTCQEQAVDKCTDVSARLLRCPKLFVRSRSHNFDRYAFAHFAVSAAGSAQPQSCQFRHTRIFNFALEINLPRASSG